MTYKQRLRHIMQQLESLRAGPQTGESVIQQCVLQSEYEVTRYKYLQKVEQNFVNLFRIYLRNGRASALTLNPTAVAIKVEVNLDARDSAEEQIWKVRDACRAVAIEVTDGDYNV
jgi:hypothetical protein